MCSFLECQKILQETESFDFNDNSILNEDLVISQTMREKRPGLNDELVVELKNRLSKAKSNSHLEN